MLPNSSIVVTAGVGETVATHTVSGKKYQAFVECDADGHVIGSRPSYTAYYTPATNASNREVGELFNAHASLIVRVRGIWIIPTLSAITGVQISWDINKLSAVGTTGSTVITPRKTDSGFANLDAAITARFGSTAGATLDHLFWQTFLLNDETNAGAGFLAYQNQLPMFGDRVSEIVLRQNQGIQVKQSNAAAVGLTGALFYFTVE